MIPKVTNPLAFPGDQVMVENYKKQNKAVESGKVMDTRTVWPSKCRNWHIYKVVLDRQTLAGKPIELDIRDRRIKKVIN